MRPPSVGLMSPSTLPGFMEPPYSTRSDPATSALNRSASVARMAEQTASACSGVAVRPVPMAQMGYVGHDALRVGASMPANAARTWR